MEKAEEKYRELTSLLDGEWESVKFENDIHTERRFLPGSDIACFRSSGYIDADPEKLFDYVLKTYDTMENMKVHDPEISHYEVVKNLSDDSRICYQVNSLSWPLWPRDLVYLQTIRQNDDNLWIYMYSIDAEEKPEQKDKYVRAKLNISGYGFIPDEEGTAVVRIAHVDPAGSIPAKIINSYADKTTTMIKELQKIFS